MVEIVIHCSNSGRRKAVLKDRCAMVGGATASKEKTEIERKTDG